METEEGKDGHDHHDEAHQIDNTVHLFLHALCAAPNGASPSNFTNWIAFLNQFEPKKFRRFPALWAASFGQRSAAGIGMCVLARMRTTRHKLGTVLRQVGKGK
jgi:hypothetical protein